MFARLVLWVHGEINPPSFALVDDRIMCVTMQELSTTRETIEDTHRRLSLRRRAKITDCKLLGKNQYECQSACPKQRYSSLGASLRAKVCAIHALNFNGTSRQESQFSSHALGEKRGRDFEIPERSLG